MVYLVLFRVGLRFVSGWFRVHLDLFTVGLDLLRAGLALFRVGLGFI